MKERVEKACVKRFRRQPLGALYRCRILDMLYDQERYCRKKGMCGVEVRASG